MLKWRTILFPTVLTMLKRLSLYTLLLCLVPLFTWLTGWHWSAQTALFDYDRPLYWLTESGSAPYAIITCGVFALLFGVFFNNRKQWLVAVAIMACSVVATQGIKTGLKSAFAEPRPFVSYVVEQTHSNAEDFYANSRKERSKIVENFYQGQSNTPEWIKGHYADEVGYSFPSGHTIFAASWLMLAVGFAGLVGKKTLASKAVVALVSVWAILMLISRLRFGMHYPIDLLVSTLIAWIVHCGLFALLSKKQKN